MMVKRSCTRVKASGLALVTAAAAISAAAGGAGVPGTPTPDPIEVAGQVEPPASGGGGDHRFELSVFYWRAVIEGTVADCGRSVCERRFDDEPRSHPGAELWWTNRKIFLTAALGRSVHGTKNEFSDIEFLDGRLLLGGYAIRTRWSDLALMIGPQIATVKGPEDRFAFLAAALALGAALKIHPPAIPLSLRLEATTTLPSAGNDHSDQHERTAALEIHPIPRVPGLGFWAGYRFVKLSAKSEISSHGKADLKFSGVFGGLLFKF
jgi:hypothetical protein